MRNCTLRSLLFTALVLSSLSLSAQFDFGITLGGNFSGINYVTVGQTDNQFEEIQGFIDQANSTPSSLGFQAGFYMNFEKERYSLGPEILYTLRPYGGKEYWETFEYITVPIRFKYKLADRFSLDLGPEFNFLMYNTYIHTSAWEGFHEIYSKVDLRAAMGATYKFQYRGALSLRYVQGLNDIIASEHLPVSQRSNSFEVAFSYSIFEYAKN